MKYVWMILFVLLLSSCTGPPTEPVPFAGHITAYVHWGDQPLSGKQIELVQTGETKLTDTNGKAEFTVSAGKFVIRAFDINRGGPAYRTIDFDVEVGFGQKVMVDIVDCLPCLYAR